MIVLNRYNDSSTCNKETKRRRKNAIANRENIFPEVAWLVLSGFLFLVSLRKVYTKSRDSLFTTTPSPEMLVKSFAHGIFDVVISSNKDRYFFKSGFVVFQNL